MNTKIKIYIYPVFSLLTVILFSCGGDQAAKTQNRHFENTVKSSTGALTLSTAQVRTAGIDTGHAVIRQVSMILKVSRRKIW